MTKLIGFGGRFAAGKDAAADHLVEAHGWLKTGMSEPLHTAMLALDPLIPISAPYASSHVRYSELVRRVGYTTAKENEEVRRLLQVLGTEIGRKMFGENVWVDIAAHNISELLDLGIDVAITGIRYLNEVDMIHNLGGTLIWIDRPSESEAVVPGLAHISEALTSEHFDEIIVNDSTLEVLHEKIEIFSQTD